MRRSTCKKIKDRTIFNSEKFCQKLTIGTITTRLTYSNYKQTQRILLCMSSRHQNALTDLDEQL